MFAGCHYSPSSAQSCLGKLSTFGISKTLLRIRMRVVAPSLKREMVIRRGFSFCGGHGGSVGRSGGIRRGLVGVIGGLGCFFRV